ncbi:hypothetical protein KHQ89_04060 [Mycoplasmatota bacterium]|nr:hypothetical protein KHQ89_04060 [Mycoplasmatota bacterium]
MKTFNFYETINDEKYLINGISCVADTLKIEINKEFYDFINDKKIIINENSVLGIDDNITFTLDDPNGIWESNKVTLNLNIKINSIRNLFGETCYVYKDAILGIGVEYKSKMSRIREAVKIASLTNKDINLDVTKTIELYNLKSDIEFKLIVYIEGKGSIGGSKSFANEIGLIIANFNFLKLKFEGESSLFPISHFIEQNGPLWKLECKYTDIYEDQFSDENVRILINKANKSYQFIQQGNSNYNPSFLSEVLSSAVATLIANILRDENDKIYFEKANSENSILSLLRYFQEKLGFDYRNGYIKLFISVKKYFDKEFKL